MATLSHHLSYRFHTVRCCNLGMCVTIRSVFIWRHSSFFHDVHQAILLVRTWIAWGLSRIIFWYLTSIVAVSYLKFNQMPFFNCVAFSPVHLQAATSIVLFIIHYHKQGSLPWMSRKFSPSMTKTFDSTAHTTDGTSSIPTIRNCVRRSSAGVEAQYLSFVCIITFELSAFTFSIGYAFQLS